MQLRAPIEYFTNLVFYHLFRLDKLSQDVFGAPVRWLIRLPAVDRSYKRRGVENAEEVINKAMYDPKRGFNIVHAGYHLTLLFYLISFGTANFLIGLFWISLDPLANKDWRLLIYFLITFIPAYIASERLAEGKKKYLKYFRQFEKKSEQWHRRTAVLTFFTVVGICGYGIGGFAFYLSRLP